MTGIRTGTGTGTGATSRATVDLTTEVGGLTLPDPVMVAAGCGGRELAPFLDLPALAGLVTRSVTLDARAGAPLPRLVETPAGLLNGVGLPGPGVDGFLATDLPWLAQQRVRTVVSIAADATEDFTELARRVGHSPGVAAVEINLGWPPDARTARDSFTAAKVVTLVRGEVPPGVPVHAKLGPDVHRAADVARAVVRAGADAVVLVNTLPGLALDRDTLRPALGSVTGGLSGPAVHAHAVRCVWEVHRVAPTVPLIGVGGVTTGWDALEMLAAGASAVQVGTAVLADPTAPARIVEELSDELGRRGIARVADVVGAAHPGGDAR